MKHYSCCLLLCISIAFIVAAASCTKGTSASPRKKDTTVTKPRIDSTALYLTRTWIFHKSEVPETSTIWITRTDVGHDYDATIFYPNDTVTMADNNNVVFIGTWKLSTDHKLLTISNRIHTETDTIDMLNDKTLQLTVPGQFSYILSLYKYERDTYVAK